MFYYRWLLFILLCAYSILSCVTFFELSLRDLQIIIGIVKFHQVQYVIEHSNESTYCSYIISYRFTESKNLGLLIFFYDKRSPARSYKSGVHKSNMIPFWHKPQTIAVHGTIVRLQPQRACYLRILTCFLRYCRSDSHYSSSSTLKVDCC